MQWITAPLFVPAPEVLSSVLTDDSGWREKGRPEMMFSTLRLIHLAAPRFF